MNDLAQQLQDIHLSDAPSWWPPAPGWWLVFLLLAVSSYLLIRLFTRLREKRKPLNQARRLHSLAYAEHLSGELTKTQYIDTCNQLLKRLLLKRNTNEQVAGAYGQFWLGLLDSEFNTDQFTHGQGKILGSLRYQNNFDPNCPGFHKLMQASLKGFKP